MSLLPNPFKRPPRAAPNETPPPSPELPFRPTLYTSRYYFSVTRRIWHILLLSTPLDLLLLLADSQVLLNLELATLLFHASAVCACAAGVAWLLRDTLIDLVFALQHTQRKLAVKSTWPAVALIAIVTLGGLAEFALRFSKVSTITVVIGGLVAYGALASILKEVRERKAEANALERDRTARIEQANYSLFLIGIIPLAGARLGSLSASLGFLFTEASEWQFMLPPLGAAALLLIFFPHLEQYTFNCQRCGMTTSRALRAGGHCPMCLMTAPGNQLLVVPSSENFAQNLLRRLESKETVPEPNQSEGTRTPHEQALTILSKVIQLLARLASR